MDIRIVLFLSVYRIKRPIMTTNLLQTARLSSFAYGYSLRQLHDALLMLGRKFETFETMMCDHSVRGDAEASFARYAESLAEEMQAQGRFKTAQAYRSAVKSLTTCFGREEIPLCRIDAASMCKYQTWLLGRGVTLNTVSFYMRILRAVHRRAVRAGLTVPDDPFRDVYTGAERTRKRAVDAGLLAVLRSAELPGGGLSFARDLFLFSFYTRGMSFVDMAYLRKGDAAGGVIVYFRRKTGRQLTIRVEPCIQEIIDRYAPHVADTPYLLPILTATDPAAAFRQYRSALVSFNRRLKEISHLLRLECGLTSYVSRHTWATTAYRRHVPTSVISEGLGHGSERMTRIYLAAFEQSELDAANRIILENL